MPLSEKQIEELITKQKTGDVEEVYGPVKFGGDWIWEIWVDNGTKTISYYETRFLVERANSEPIYFDSFLGLSGYLNDLYQASSVQSGAIDWTRTKELADLQLKKITLYVGATVFSATVLTMLVIVFLNQTGLTPETKQSENIKLIITAILGIVSSGGALFFGRWLPFQNKNSRDGTEIEPSIVTTRQVGRRKKP